MEKLNFSININAPRERVWKVLFDEWTYRDWTSVFAPGSYAETDWSEGSKALFLDGNGNGMVSRIAKSKPHEYLSIEHLGIVKDGKEDTQIKDWNGAIESYILKQTEDGTVLKIEMDANEEWKDYFSKTWPLALSKVKEISEK
jgi:hypothetical protein